jgi:hypothetical protein
MNLLLEDRILCDRWVNKPRRIRTVARLRYKMHQLHDIIEADMINCHVLGHEKEHLHVALNALSGLVGLGYILFTWQVLRLLIGELGGLWHPWDPFHEDLGDLQPKVGQLPNFIATEVLL